MHTRLPARARATFTAFVAAALLAGCAACTA